MNHHRVRSTISLIRLVLRSIPQILYDLTMIYLTIRGMLSLMGWYK